MRKKRIQLALILCVLLASLGCIKKTGAPVTPWERIMTDNAILAQFADTAEQGTEMAVTTTLLTTMQARPVIIFENRFADTHKKITAILAQGPGTADLAQVKTLLETLKAEGVAIVNSGNIGVKNPKTQQTINADITNIINLAEAVISDVQLFQSGGGK